MLENVQIIKEHGKAKFAVIDYAEFETIQSILSDREKLEDYLDYLHIQSVKKQSTHRFSLDEVKEILANTDSDS